MIVTTDGTSPDWVMVISTVLAEVAVVVRGSRGVSTCRSPECVKGLGSCCLGGNCDVTLEMTDPLDCGEANATGCDEIARLNAVNGCNVVHTGPRVSVFGDHCKIGG